MTHTWGHVPINKETVLPMYGNNGPNHHRHNTKCGQAAENPKEKGDAAQKFGEDIYIYDSDGQTHPRHALNGVRQTVATEPSQDLLGPVHKEDDAQDDSDDSECIFLGATA